MKDLLTNSDIKEIEKKESLTPLDYRILSESTWSESQVQSACYNIIKAKYSSDNVTFQQNDNGGNLKKGGKIKKWREGTQAGFPDVTIWLWNSMNESAQIFVEFKKVGSPSQIKPSENQIKWHKFLIKKEELAHFCNNTTYFEMTICSQIDWFFKKKVGEQVGNIWL